MVRLRQAHRHSRFGALCPGRQRSYARHPIRGRSAGRNHYPNPQRMVLPRPPGSGPLIERGNMKLTASKTVLAVCSCTAFAMGSEPKVERHPLQIGTVVDIGQIVKGEGDVFADFKPYDGQMIQRTSVYLNQFTTVNERLNIKV